MRRNAKKSDQPSKPKRKSSHEDASDATAAPRQIIRSREPRRSFCRRLSDNLASMKYVIPFLFVPSILNLSLLRQEALSFYSAGAKVDMGWGQKMHIYCKGEGIPAVVLDAPTGYNSDIWFFIHEQLAEVTQVCVYDRSGIGNSDAPFSDVTMNKDFAYNKRYVVQPSTVHQMVNDLNHLVTKAHPLPHPLILVGSEIGALVARMYASLHTDDVTDIVLVDPLVENLLLDSEAYQDYWYSTVVPAYEALHLSAAVGLSRIAFLFGLLHPTFFEEEVPDEVLKRQMILLCNPWHINAAFNEHANMNISFSQMVDIVNMKPIPESVDISVIRREEPEEIPPNLMEVWQNSQDLLVNKLHSSTKTFLVPDKKFHKFYSSSSPIIEILKNVINSWRQKYGGFSTFVQ